MQIRKPSNRFVTSLLLVLLLVGGVFIFWQIQKVQELRERANEVSWSTDQSATPACGASGTVLITVSFTNTETTQSMKVTATDTQSGVSVDLGTVGPGKTTTGQIDTKLASVQSGTVNFLLSWTDGTVGTDTKTATYTAVTQCSTVPVCTEINHAICTWDALAGVTSYNVTVKDITSGTVVDSETVSSTQLVFDSQPGETYSCSVSAQNACGTGAASEGTGASCPLQPTPTPGVCVPNQSTCTWDALPGISQYNVSIINTDTGDVVKSGQVMAPGTSFTFPSVTGVSYQCSVTPVNVCGSGPTAKGQPTVCQQPTPTPTPSIPETPTETPAVSISPTVPVPTGTPVPTNTPTPAPTSTPYPTFTPAPTQIPYPTYTPAPTPTPVVLVQTLPTTPPQVIQVPGPTQIVQVPGPQQIVQVPVQEAARITPQPTIGATGSTTTTALILGAGGLFVTLGGLLFFLL